MGQQRQQFLILGGRHQHINNAGQMKKYCIWGLGLVVPFLVLFCIFPSATSLYRPPIVIHQLQVSSHARSDHEKLASDVILDQNDAKKQSKPHKVSTNHPKLTSLDTKNQNDGRKPAVSSAINSKSVDLVSKKDVSKKAKKQISMIDQELDKQIGVPNADIQMKKNGKKGKSIHPSDEIPVIVDRELSFSGKAEADQHEEVSLSLISAKSSSGRKPAMFDREGEEEISSLGKEISEDEEEPTGSSKQLTRKAMGLRSDDFIADFELDDAEEVVSSLGKGRSSKKRTEKEVNDVKVEERLTESGKMKESYRSSARKSDELDDAGEVVSYSGKGRSSKKRTRKETEEVNDVEVEERLTESGKMSSGRKADELDDAEEVVSSLGKGSGSKKRTRKETEEVNDVEVEERLTESGKMEESEGETDLLFLERADEKMFVTKERKDDDDQLKQQQSQDADDNKDDPMEHSRVISKALPFNPKPSKSPGECKYSKGRWIIESKDPLYMDSTCPLMSINDEEDCKVIKRRRKSGYWRWQPIECDMEQFRAKTFLKLMGRKSLAFIGDKLAKAQMHSLVCLLAQVERPNLVYNDKINQSMSWHFSSSNVTLSMVWSPYLVQEINEQGYKKLRLDKLDTKWAVMVPTLDVIVLGIGPLFLHPTIYTVRDEVVGCYACQALATHIDIKNMKEISLYSGFRATMRSSIMGIGALPGFKGITFFLQPFGFEGNGSYHGVSMKMKEIQEEELHQARKRGSISNHSKMDVLHTHLVRMSKDDPMQGLLTSTCSIPGPLADTWNQFLQHTLTHI